MITSGEPCPKKDCILLDLHQGPHLFKCSGRYCPGLPWSEVNTPHPTSCRVARLADPNIVAERDGYASAAAVRRIFSFGRDHE